MSIPKMTEKIKSLAKTSTGKDVLSIVVIVIISFGSFLLGRNSTTNNETSQIQVSGAREVLGKNINTSYTNADKLSQNNSNDNLIANASINTNENIYAKGNYLASSRGKKYYPIDCPASQNIKEVNRIYFKTASEAETKGYTLSGSCN